ncbi:hypothetical protein BM525_19030 (plasmid) [Alteromonas mediterranea]|uniref:DUF1566 domain-containing protein n=1 Tax=Alteromonas mediterranea TaxID=314275 RepID=A0AAC9JHT4_9ALTE|nr:hypothetical protein [Alteromonas mediterranea]APD91978.1 hypothetical protein BM524_18835 [Alteromonas mediterranea]APD99832.1 hypothetical protein BM525_19030 [Alteromonas mediterranea]
MKRLFFALAAIPLSFSATVNAELAHADWQADGDNAITLDSDAGLEWLKLDNTVGLSINDVLSGMVEGGAFEDWRLPTSQEVQSLLETVLPEFTWNDEATATTYSSANYSGYSTRWNTWLGTSNYVYKGNGSAYNRYWYSYGLHVENDNTVHLTGTYRWHRNAWGSHTHSTVLYDDRYVDGYDVDFSNAYTGVYLVSDGGAALPSNVSTPGFLGALSLLTFAGLRRRKK